MRGKERARKGEREKERGGGERKRSQGADDGQLWGISKVGNSKCCVRSSKTSSKLFAYNYGRFFNIELPILCGGHCSQSRNNN